MEQSVGQIYDGLIDHGKDTDVLRWEDLEHLSRKVA